MIYKCKNCGTTFKTHPGYCECGNNTFVEIADGMLPQKAKPSEEASTVPPATAEILPTNIEYIKSKLPDKKKILDIIALIVFVLSLIFSVGIIISAFTLPSGNNKAEQHASKPVKSNINIPDINTFWTGEVPTEKQEISNKILPKEKPVVKNEQDTKKIVKQKAKPKSSSVSQQKTKTQTKPKNKIEQKPKTLPKSKTSKDEEIITPKPKSNNSNVIELTNYKIAIRKSLFSAFPILNVQGKGVCTIAFSVSSEGKLLNRRFVRQSENKSLNDAMYHMLMRTPSYNPPPPSYRGEDFVLEMSFDNGNYSFAYK